MKEKTKKRQRFLTIEGIGRVPAIPAKDVKPGMYLTMDGVSDGWYVRYVSKSIDYHRKNSKVKIIIDIRSRLGKSCHELSRTPTELVPARFPREEELTEGLFVYGTLKNGFKLFHHYMFEGSCQFLRTGTWDGFTLYNCGSYPAAIPKKGSHVSGEIWLVTKEVKNRVQGMEMGAGYKVLTKMVSTEKYPYSLAVSIFFQDWDVKRKNIKDRLIGPTWTERHDKRKS